MIWYYIIVVLSAIFMRTFHAAISIETEFTYTARAVCNLMLCNHVSTQC